MNALEQMAFFLPSLWLCAFYLSDIAQRLAGLFGSSAALSMPWRISATPLRAGEG